ncbi:MULTISPECIES: cell division protein ZapE [Hyphomonas]|uniref:AFG1 family ATPase n=2 Tax=Hyphomonas adhaerens TaxID=81029 RepID=A0A069E611_9PROT|nr:MULTISPECIES: cell division protein ZapE [Hyphomonas]KCZ85424.1 AFG1 family ATPase [Hyphomonas adhaerens MHS-3]MBB41231.1 cell division protein ZapE [Hyphomonas sp.]HAE26690.1 cell division protein ZapE [Hyphomonas adhaerens]|tara:strand:+ start:26601 stop:27728 length:1128 start_codon:yes stop_codon:yes gene_type:complete
MANVVRQYRERVEAGLLTNDPVQAEAAERLDDLAKRLADPPKGGWFSKPDPVRGLYLWGGVGRGKSMLMDLFFEDAAPKAKRRVHFHEFMAEIQDRLDTWRKMPEGERKRSQWRVKGAGDDPIPPVAKQVAAEAQLLCFDEFQVTQIADAMILARLFDQLFSRGVTMVATSNRVPDDLYKDGINRPLFLPFIQQLKERCDIFHLASDRDYRLDRLIAAPVWYAPLGPEADASLEEVWTRLTSGAHAQHVTLTVKGRKLEVSREAAGVAWFSFEELCARPLYSRDYLTIAANFHTVILRGIPKLDSDKRNEAARFVALIDALYEAKVKLVASAAAEPETLYPEGDGAFEFERTVSRLHEMRSTDYLAEERVEISVD